MTRRVANPWQGQTCNRNCCVHCPTGNHVAARLHLSTRSVKTAISYFVPRCKISWQTESGQLSPKDRTWGVVFDRRKFRSQTSDNMDRWKSIGGKSQRRAEKKQEDQRRERVRRKKMQVREKVKVANRYVFPITCGSGGSKSRVAKAAGAEPSGQNCTSYTNYTNYTSCTVTLITLETTTTTPYSYYYYDHHHYHHHHHSYNYKCNYNYNYTTLR